jgi:Flagella basal body rod protein
MRRSGHHLPTGRFCPVESDRVDPTFFLLFNYLRSILGDFPHGTTFAVRMTGLLGRRFMDITTSLAASRLVAQQRAMDITANNIANANTPGFRTERVQFSDWIDRQPASAPGGRTVTYTQDRATYRESQPGTLTHTANPLDLALTGEGYFTVNTKAGPRLTRDGRFGLMPDGTVADSNGNPPRWTRPASQSRSYQPTRRSASPAMVRFLRRTGRSARSGLSNRLTR